MTLEEALELFRQEKASRRTASRTVLRELGAHPQSGAAIRLLEGRYGPYVTDGTTNASLPKGTDGEAVTLETAVGLLAAREGAKPRGRARGGSTRAASSRRRSGTR